MAENKLADLSIDFAIEILKICDCVKVHSIAISCNDYIIGNYLSKKSSP